MIVDKQKLIQLLNHPTEGIKHSAASALAGFFNKEPDVLAHILHILETSENKLIEYIGLVNYLELFTIEESHLKRILQLYRTIRSIDSDELEIEVAEEELIELIYTLPLPLLEKSLGKIIDTKEFPEIDEVVKQKKQILQKTPIAMWNELSEACNRYLDAVMPDDEFHYALFLVEVLAEKKSFVEDQVEKLLQSQKELDYHRTVFVLYFLVLAKLPNYIDYVISLLKSYELDDIQHDLCMDYLITIGDKNVIEHLKNIYGNQLEIDFLVCDVLARIPTRESEDTLLRFLQQETELETKTLLGVALMEIFSKKGIAKVADLIRSKQFIPSVADLYESMTANLAYHNIPSEKYADLKELYSKALEEEMQNMEELDDEEIDEFTSSNGAIRKN